jgi:membrane protease YdiL (CAAX protease family)
MPRASAFGRVLLALILGFAALFVGAVFLSLAGGGRPGPPPGPPWLPPALNHAGMLLGSLALILLLSRGRPALYGLRLPARFPAVAVLLLTLGITALASVVNAVLPGAGLTFTAGYTFPQTVLGVWIFASVAEETLTRGLVQGYLAPLADRAFTIGRLRLSLPVIAGAVFFSAMHLALFTMGIDASTVLQIVAFALVVGMVAGYARERSGSLLPAILVHMLANAGGWAVDRLL